MKLYFNKNYFINPASELAILSPFVDSFKSDNRFKDILNDDTNELTSIEECDYVVMPYKWNRHNPNNQRVFNEAKNYDKKVLIFFNDDSDEPIDVDNSYVFRTSFYKSNKKDYEKSLPAFKVDNFRGNYIEDPEINIGFCGQVETPLRQQVIRILKESDMKCDFIIREDSWPLIDLKKSLYTPILSLDLVRKVVESEFYHNMNNNLFNLCIRGGGNFSYRLYETLMYGRIPVIIDTDLVLPYDDIIDWEKYAVIIRSGENISKISDFFNNNDMKEVQRNNRKFWEEYLSPKGFIKNISKVLMYKENRGLKEWKIDETFPLSFMEKCKTFDIDPNSVRFYSQQDEDKYIIQHILKDKIEDGTFLELGACDGILYSNTKMLEDHFGFTGILIEPLSNYYTNLENNRPNCENYNCAVSNYDAEYVSFSGNDAEAGITQHLKNGGMESVQIKNRKMKDIFIESKFNHIDIFILDVEGAELEVLKSIDFDEIDIYCIFFEAHSDQQEKNLITGEYLKEKGFVYKDRQRGNEVWINTNSKRRDLFQEIKKEETV